MQFLRMIGKRPAGRSHTSWLATMKNRLSSHTQCGRCHWAGIG